MRPVVGPPLLWLLKLLLKMDRVKASAVTVIGRTKCCQRNLAISRERSKVTTRLALQGPFNVSLVIDRGTRTKCVSRSQDNHCRR